MPTRIATYITRKRRPIRDAKPDMHKIVNDKFYTCHPTKGWRKLSWKRIRAGMGVSRNGTD